VVKEKQQEPVDTEEESADEESTDEKLPQTQMKAE